MIYFSTGACHSPLQVHKKWINKFKGKFDQGWDKLREETFDRQKKGSIVPGGTQLTPRPKEIPSWDEYPDRYKPVASRLMELWAGFLAHTDAQIGRLAEAIQDLGVWDNTLFIYMSVITEPAARARFMARGVAPLIRTAFQRNRSGCCNTWMISGPLDARTTSMWAGRGRLIRHSSG